MMEGRGFSIKRRKKQKTKSDGKLLRKIIIYCVISKKKGEERTICYYF